jgi:hypothetical protein
MWIGLNLSKSQVERDLIFLDSNRGSRDQNPRDESYRPKVKAIIADRSAVFKGRQRKKLTKPGAAFRA